MLSIHLSNGSTSRSILLLSLLEFNDPLLVHQLIELVHFAIARRLDIKMNSLSSAKLHVLSEELTRVNGEILILDAQDNTV